MTTHVVFLSHQSQDKDLVRRVARYLEGEGIETIVDEWAFVKGRGLPDQIAKALSRSTAFLLFWSHAATGSKYVQYEEEIAKAREIKDDTYSIQVVLLDNTLLPDKYSALLYHDWRRGRPGSKMFEIHLRKLKRAIAGLPDQDRPTHEEESPEPSHLLVRPAEFVGGICKWAKCEADHLRLEWWEASDFGSSDRPWVPRGADRWLAGTVVEEPVSRGVRHVRNLFDDPYFWGRGENFGKGLITALGLSKQYAAKTVTAIAIDSKIAQIDPHGVPMIGDVCIVFDGPLEL